MKNVNRKFRHLLQAGMKLFWKHGIRRVTVEEICALAEVSRVTFYKYFKDKENLAMFILKMNVEEGMEKYRQIMDDSDSYESKIRRMIELKIESSGEMSSEMLKDLLSGDFPKLHEFFQQASKKNIEIFLNDFKEAQKNGDIRKDLNIELILYMLNRMIEMATDKQLEKMYPATGQRLEELTKFFFYGVLPDERKEENLTK